MDRTHTEREREGGLRKTDLFWAQPNWPIQILQAFPLTEEAVGLVLMATVCLTYTYCEASVTMERESGL